MKSLLIVDMQNDFCPGGALPVKDGNKIVDIINKLQESFELVIVTQDWHPNNHISFARTHNKKPGEIIIINGIKQVLWPDHCIQDTYGADFVKSLNKKKIKKIIKKGTDSQIDSYSGFFDNERKKETELRSYLNENNVKELFIVGLATDYCVKYTALDSASLGFKTNVIIDATKGINDVNNAVQEMKNAGINIISSAML